jgi:hypothetical protein
MIHPSLKPDLEALTDKEYVLLNEFEFENFGIKVKIPAGFVFDGASIPRLLWVTAGSPYQPQYIGPALIHDYIYTYHNTLKSKITRAQADSVFKQCLLLNKVHPFQANRMYAAVRTFGYFHW